MQIGNATTSACQPAMRDGASRARESPDSGSGTQKSTEQFAEPSALKSFAYGTLGLERPEAAAANTDGFYTAGKWVAAAATVGGIKSLFV
ncbi:hypothetical protein BGLT_00664 [Caballeronia glathei]|uniref:Uncharacterized protein n=1 Tax=Caballeronia glathei TaxID=60547 RepID=A0A069PTB9_9BURK|nr:hypothetical protein [Caballeronia glathei]KDR44023.1 hypothetical protein BG61_25135 [Caballeronia glathei]CDY74377.1 hypothetical protein BGLT_00664 [Caballeronia glathei]